MINFTAINEKDTVVNGANTKKVLFKITAKTKKKAAKKRIPLNISLVIDVSGSMNDSVGQKALMNNVDYSAIDFLKSLDPQNGVNKNGSIFSPRGNEDIKTKLSQVKEAAIKCLDLMQDGDYLSVVVFNNYASIAQEAVKINQKSINDIRQKIINIHASGGTNLHDGWLKGGLEVAKNLSTKYINRVLILTDGETNQGIQSVDEIAKHVAGLSQKGIATSTFGVGDHYNEDLLEKIASVSGGNFYYIEDETKALSILMEEFSCLNNIVADSATLEFEANNGAKISCINELDYANNKYVVGNLINGREVLVLMEYSFNNQGKIGEKYELGKMKLEFVNEKGKKEVIELTLDYLTVSESNYEKTKINAEVDTQYAILDIAKKQKNAKEAFKKGQRDYGMNILRDTITAAQLYASDARVSGEINQMNTMMQDSDMSNERMSKVLSSMSYSTRASKK